MKDHAQESLHSRIMNQDQTEAMPKLAVSFEVDGSAYTGRLTSLEERAIVVAFSGSSVRALPLPGRTRVSFKDESLGVEFHAAGLVRHWLREGDQDCLRIELRDEYLKQLEEALFPQRAERTSVRGGKPIRVSVKTLASDSGVSAALVDLSEGGLALILTPSEDRSFAASFQGSADASPWYVRLELQIPEKDAGVSLVGEICYRMAARSYVKYGTRFDPERSAEINPDALAGIQEYIDWFRRDAQEAA